MKRYVFQAILKMCAKAIALTAIIGAIIGIIGYVKQWDSTIKYSNAFFLAGCLMIIAGTSARYAASQGWNSYQLLDGEGFEGMGATERAIHIINDSSPIRTVILGVLTGLLLIGISAIAAYLL